MVKNAFYFTSEALFILQLLLNSQNDMFNFVLLKHRNIYPISGSRGGNYIISRRKQLLVGVP